MAGMMASMGGYQQASGGPTGQTLQAPIKGLRAAMAPTDAPPMVPSMPNEDADAMPDRTPLGVRTPSDPISILMDMVRQRGRAY